MKVTVSVEVMFDSSDMEECCLSRSADVVCLGNWDAVPDAVGEALKMIDVPRPVDMCSKVVLEVLSIAADDNVRPEEAGGHKVSGLIRAASDVVHAYKELDSVVARGVAQEVVKAHERLAD